MNKQFLVMALTDIIPYENNPRINDEAVADVVESIRQCENLDPIEIDENNVILSGHTRLKALQELGFEKTEVMKYTGLTEEQKKKYRLLANKTGEKAEWDFSKLEKELEGLDFGDFDFEFDTPEQSWEQVQKNEESKVSPQFTPDGVMEGAISAAENEDDPYLPDGYNDIDIQSYADNSENYVMKRRVIITYLPEQENKLKALLGIDADDVKVVYDIDELIGGNS